MSLGLSALERLARARSDLRMGVAVGAARRRRRRRWRSRPRPRPPTRLADFRALGPVDLAITGWRAETLKARAYDGDLARVALPARRRPRLGAGDGGPFGRSRLSDEGAVRDAARRRRRRCTGRRSRSASGAPAAGGAGGAARRRPAGGAGRRGRADRRRGRRRAGRARRRRRWSRSPRRGCRSRSARPGGCGCSGRSTAPRSTTPSRSARRTGGRRCSAGCIRPASPATCSAA